MLRQSLKKIRSLVTFWVAARDLDHLQALRAAELQSVLELLPTDGKLLEVGAGTGWQAKAFQQHGYEVYAIDLPSSNYRDDRVWPISEYDGQHIPFDDQFFDIVFSSNALEHVPHVAEFQNELLRVLKSDGCAIHVLPSSSWRFWTNVSHVLKCWTFPTPHGEHATNAVSEILIFSRRHWRRLFREAGWVVVDNRSNRLFYTGWSVLGSRLKLGVRRKLSYALGGACNIFLLRVP